MQKTADGVGYISTADPTRETLGTQWIRAMQKQHQQQEAGETVSAFSPQYLAELESSIRNTRNAGIKGKIHICVWEVPLGEQYNNAVKLNFYIRRTRTHKPKWNQTLWSHDEHDDYPTLEYTLPSEEEAIIFEKNPELTTSRQLSWIAKMRSGTLR